MVTWSLVKECGFELFSSVRFFNAIILFVDKQSLAGQFW